eukprot:jgi/Mesvir1/2388/Mv25135-RA.1
MSATKSINPLKKMFGSLIPHRSTNRDENADASRGRAFNENSPPNISVGFPHGMNAMTTPFRYESVEPASTPSQMVSASSIIKGSVSRIPRTPFSATRKPLAEFNASVPNIVNEKADATPTALQENVARSIAGSIESGLATCLFEGNLAGSDDNIKVIVRLRPLNDREVLASGRSKCLQQSSNCSVTFLTQPEKQVYTFDHVAGETATQENVFQLAGIPVVKNCVAGYNSSLFAYGQTGSGKTWTMTGQLGHAAMERPRGMFGYGDRVPGEEVPHEDRGIIPRVFENLFAYMRQEERSSGTSVKFLCKCSFLEIYNEHIADLLRPESTNLNIREDIKRGVYVESLAEEDVFSVDDAMAILAQGTANRKVAMTSMNRESSRSHSVFTLVIESKRETDAGITNIRYSRLNLIDLAGSERQKSSGALGERLKEASSINKSLSTLGHVIMSLADLAQGKVRHVPYRDSRLTFLLQDSLGGNAKTIMVANVSPSNSAFGETLSTLKFAQRAKFIRNKAVVNEDTSGDVSLLKDQIRKLKEELMRVRTAAAMPPPLAASIAFPSSSFGTPGPHAQNGPGGWASKAGIELGSPGDRNLLSVSPLVTPGATAGDRSSKAQALQKALTGALRREQAQAQEIVALQQKLAAQEQLLGQREHEVQSTRMLLKMREDKIARMVAATSAIGGKGAATPADTQRVLELEQQCATLQEEARLLRARLERHPDVTKKAIQVAELEQELHKMKQFHDFGERGRLLGDIAGLRTQLLEYASQNEALVAQCEEAKLAAASMMAAGSSPGQEDGDMVATGELEELRMEVAESAAQLLETKAALADALMANAALERAAASTTENASPRMTVRRRSSQAFLTPERLSNTNLLLSQSFAFGRQSIARGARASICQLESELKSEMDRRRSTEDAAAEAYSALHAANARAEEHQQRAAEAEAALEPLRARLLATQQEAAQLREEAAAVASNLEACVAQLASARERESALVADMAALETKSRAQLLLVSDSRSEEEDALREQMVAAQQALAQQQEGHVQLINDFQSRLQLVTDALDERDAMLERMAGELEALRGGWQRAEDQLKAKTAEAAQAAAACEAQRQELGDVRQTFAELRGREEDTMAQLAQLSEGLEEALAACHRKDVAMDKVEAALAREQARALALEGELAVAQEALDAARSDVEEARAGAYVQASAQEGEVAALRAALASAETNTAALAERLAAVERERGALQEQARRAAAEQEAALAASRRDAEQKYAALQDDWGTAVAECADLRQRFEALLREREAAMAEFEQRRSELNAGMEAAERLQVEALAQQAACAQVHEEVVALRLQVAKLDRDKSELIGQRNPNARIKHFEAVKDENGRLKAEADELHKKLLHHERLVEELAKHRAAAGRPEMLPVEEEERLRGVIRLLEADKAQVLREMQQITQQVLDLAAILGGNAAGVPAAGAAPMLADGGLPSQADASASSGTAGSKVIVGAGGVAPRMSSTAAAALRTIASQTKRYLRKLEDQRLQLKLTEERGRLHELRASLGGAALSRQSSRVSSMLPSTQGSLRSHGSGLAEHSASAMAIKEAGYPDSPTRIE